ncbi:MAG: hypothetical protein EXR45_05545 [Chloroflexi bacterium]|nr:hypothetical protein [Chloroflexota bacterium]
MNVNPTAETSAHPEPTPFLPQAQLRKRPATRASLAIAATAVPEYKPLLEADAAELGAWKQWTAARAAHQCADGEIALQKTAERCAVAWKTFIDAEARRSVASVAWRHAYRALPAFSDLLMATALASLASPSTERLAA